MARVFHFIRLGGHLSIGLVIIFMFWPLASRASKARIERWYATRLLNIVGVQVSVQGLERIHGSQRTASAGRLFCSNHVSWLDIFALNSVSPLTFIAKSEIAQWPVAGRLAKASGTLFIERGRRHAVRDVIEQAVDVLHGGRDVAVFPEGTTGPGDHVLPFHSNFVQTAILAGVEVIPVSLRFVDVRGRWTDRPAFIGEQTLLENLQVLLSHRGQFQLTIHFHPAIPTEGLNRRDLTAQCRSQIQAGLV